MRPTLRRASVALVLASGLTCVTGCAAGGDDVRDRLVDITAAANDRDADALRRAADDLVSELAAQRAAGELDAAEAERLTQLAQQVRADADLIDQDVLDAETARQESEQAAREAAEEAARQAEEKAREAEQEARELAEKGQDKGKDKDKDDKKDDEQDDG